MKKIKLEVVKITPAMAANLLSSNEGNRKISKRAVAFLSRQMKDGDWKLTHQPIAIDKEGKLLDGQHRLTALIDSGTTQEFPVAYDVPRENFAVIDTGKSRLSGDVLSIKGYKNANQLAATARFILNFSDGDISNAIAQNRGGKTSKHKVVTNETILKFVENNRDLADDIPEITHHYYSHFKFIPPSYAIGIYYLLKDKYPKLVYEFYDKLFLGIDIPKDSAVRYLRDRLINDSSNQKSITKKNKLALFIKAWNSFKKNESVGGLRYDSKKEEFPELI